MDNCPMCNCPNEPMGELGPVIWYRCRGCGIDYSNESYNEDARLDACRGIHNPHEES